MTQEQKDRIYNALVVGMALPDAYIYAGLSAADIEEADSDVIMQRQWAQYTHEYEFSLLERLGRIMDKQERVGKETATTWMLERINPRYSGKAQENGGSIHLHFQDRDPATLDTVEVHKSI